MNFKILIFCILYLVSGVGCAQHHDAKSDGEELLDDLSMEITFDENWSDFTSADWREKLNLSDQCIRLNEEEERRLIDKILLDSDNYWLVLTCNLGAYQDAYYVYHVNRVENTIKPIIFELPEYTDKWRFKNTGLIWGSIYLDENNKQLEIINLSAALGVCGYIAYSHRKTINTNYRLAYVSHPEKVTVYSGF